MNIQVRNQLLITPLFLLLAGAISMLIGQTQYQERVWGLRQQVTSIAETAAAFCDQAVVANPNLPVAEAVKPVLEKALPASGALSLTFSPEAQPLDGPILQGSNNVMIASSPVLRNEAPVGHIVVTTDAGPVLEAHAATVTGLTVFTLLATAVGALIAALLSASISRGLGDLAEVTRNIAGDQAVGQEPIVQSRIKEIEDLSNTFQTMGRILESFRAKAQLQILETLAGRGNRLRNSAPILQTGLRAQIATLPDSAEQIASLVSEKDAPVPWVALAALPPVPPRERFPLTEAVRRWLAARIAMKTDFKTAADDACKRFKLPAIILGYVEGKESRFVSSGNAQQNLSAMPLLQGRGVVLHSLDSAAAEAL